MAGNELHMKDRNEIKRLWKLGIRKRAIARITKVHRNTVSKYIEEFIAENLPQENKTAAPELQSNCLTWFDELDWEKIRTEYLRGRSEEVV